MKRLLLFFGIIPQILFSQITVDQNDMPASGDTIYYGISNVPGFNPSETGISYFWDFSALSALSHRSDTFLTVYQTPAVYNVIFNPLVANLACINQTPPALGSGLTITDYYDFFKKNSSYYQKVGFGAKINNIPTPVKYDNPEIYYSFPLNYGNSDSSVSSFNLSVPGFGYFGQTINRKYIVDGWGTLTVPFGTFNVLRVKTTINVTDTLYLDTLMFGYTINRPTSNEYYWIANSLQGHVLKISQNGMVYSAEFLDSLNTSVKTHDVTSSVEIFPCPATSVVSIITPFSGQRTDITVYDIFGKQFKHNTVYNSSYQLGVSELPSGIYFVEIRSESENVTKKLSVIH